MSLLQNNQFKSEQQMVDELRDAGIAITFRPKAVVPVNFNDYSREPAFGGLTKEIDINEAYQALIVRKSLNFDPFS